MLVSTYLLTYYMYLSSHDHKGQLRIGRRQGGGADWGLDLVCRALVAIAVAVQKSAFQLLVCCECHALGAVRKVQAPASELPTALVYFVRLIARAAFRALIVVLAVESWQHCSILGYPKELALSFIRECLECSALGLASSPLLLLVRAVRQHHLERSIKGRSLQIDPWVLDRRPKQGDALLRGANL